MRVRSPAVEPGAAGNRTRRAPADAAASKGASNPDSAQIATPRTVAEIERARRRGRAEPLLAFTKMSFSLDTNDTPVGSEYLGDVCLASRSTLGNAKADSHSRFTRSPSELQHSLVVQRDRVLGVASGIHRPGEGHLREKDEITAHGLGLDNDLQMGREISTRFTLVALKCRQQDTHTLILVQDIGEYTGEELDRPRRYAGCDVLRRPSRRPQRRRCRDALRNGLVDESVGDRGDVLAFHHHTRASPGSTVR